MHWLDGCSRISTVGGKFFGTLQGRWMDNNLGSFGEVLGLFVAF